MQKRILSPGSAAVLWTVIYVLAASSLAWPANYARAAFPHWSDLDRDGKNTRQEEVTALQVRGPVWVCPYTGAVFTDPGLLDLDHIVPLAWAWHHGAAQWSIKQRQLFANDPANLELVAAAANRAKGAQGPELWLPPNLAYASQYIENFRAICRKYDLACDDAGLRALAERYKQITNGGRIW